MSYKMNVDENFEQIRQRIKDEISEAVTTMMEDGQLSTEEPDEVIEYLTDTAMGTFLNIDVNNPGFSIVEESEV